MRDSTLRSIGSFPISKILIPVDWISESAIADFTDQAQVEAAIDGATIAINERFLHTPGNVAESGIYRWTGTLAERVADFPAQRADEYYEVHVESTQDKWYTYNEGGVTVGTDPHQWVKKTTADTPFILSLSLPSDTTLSTGNNVIPFITGIVNKGTWDTADLTNHHYQATETFRDVIDLSLSISPHVAQGNPGQDVIIERSVDSGVTWETDPYRTCWEIDPDQYKRQAVLIVDFTAGYYYRFTIRLGTASAEDIVLSSGSGVTGGTFSGTEAADLGVVDPTYVSEAVTNQVGDTLDYDTTWAMSPLGTAATSLVVTAHDIDTDPALTTPLATSAVITAGIGIGQSVTVPIAGVDTINGVIPRNIKFKAEVA